MRCKHRIWLLPIMSAVIGGTAFLINSRRTANTSAALVRIEATQYPLVEHLRTVQAEFARVQELLQQAVAVGDHGALDMAGAAAERATSALKQARQLKGVTAPIGNLRTAFDEYFASATRATRVPLGAEQLRARLGNLIRNVTRSSATSIRPPPRSMPRSST
jgi:methyl-accepting chemotaxis protein